MNYENIYTDKEKTDLIEILSKGISNGFLRLFIIFGSIFIGTIAIFFFIGFFSGDVNVPAQDNSNSQEFMDGVEWGHWHGEWEGCLGGCLLIKNKSFCWNHCDNYMIEKGKFLDGIELNLSNWEKIK